MKQIDLLECRDKLDVIDREIVRLFEERMAICGDVAEYKIGTGKAVYDAERERQKIAAAQSLTHSDFNRDAIKEVFSQLMAISRKFQYGLLAEHGKAEPTGFYEVETLKTFGARVVYQGVEGAYSHAAARTFFGEHVNAYHVKSFEDTMRELEEGRADFAVLPIENSTAGIVSENYDLLVEYDNYIVGDQVIQIKHALLGLQDACLEDITTVYSHPQALMQCGDFLYEHSNWEKISLKNTAVSAKKVMEDGDKTHAAIASTLTADLYGLKVLDDTISNTQNNATRFIIVTNKKICAKNANKVSICFEIAHESGSLYHMLSHFIYNNINMTNIQSRPIKGKNWEYRFFVDFEGRLEDTGVINALRGIKEEATSMKILGTY